MSGISRLAGRVQTSEHHRRTAMGTRWRHSPLLTPRRGRQSPTAVALFLSKKGKHVRPEAGLPHARSVSNASRCNMLGSVALILDELRQITNNFSDDQLLGKGAFGKVYKGVLKNGDMIAVKRLTWKTTGLQDVEYENEARHLMRLKHPNIVQIVGYCSETEMKLVRHSGTFVRAEETERLLCLEYLQKETLRGHISDFGLSRLFGEDQTRTCTTICKGTPGYMAPEYLDKGVITKKFDIFSLGVLNNWRHRLTKAQGYTSQDIDYQQIKKCIHIGLLCVKIDRVKRPTINQIIKMLERSDEAYQNEREIPEELRKVLASHFNIIPGARIEKNLPPTYKLVFVTSMSDEIFTKRDVRAVDGGQIRVKMIVNNQQDNNCSRLLSSNVKIVVLDGDFNADNREGWTPYEFDDHIVRPRDKVGAVLTGKLDVKLKDGEACLHDITFIDNSSFTRSRKFRLGVKLLDDLGERVQEGVTEPFTVKDRRGEGYRKREIPRLDKKPYCRQLDNVPPNAETMVYKETCQNRHVIDLNIPQMPSDFESTVSYIVPPSDKNAETMVRPQRTSGAEEVTGRLPDIDASSDVLYDELSFNSRRHSSRSRPPTARALEALACGFLGTKQKGREATFPSSSRSSRPVRRPRRSPDVALPFPSEGKECTSRFPDPPMDVNGWRMNNPPNQMIHSSSSDKSTEKGSPDLFGADKSTDKGVHELFGIP
ncbi:uncharacterized protein [Miscanthus floridulus]|uniref:uncharacterized protein isoform X2 n=1 Tax=Miscanthus floridulus TaxID=154761 RepID=UPI0034593405